MQEKAADEIMRATNSIRLVMGPSGTTVTFPNEIGLPSIFDSKPHRYIFSVVFYSPLLFKVFSSHLRLWVQVLQVCCFCLLELGLCYDSTLDKGPLNIIRAGRFYY